MKDPFHQDSFWNVLEDWPPWLQYKMTESESTVVLANSRSSFGLSRNVVNRTSSRSFVPKQTTHTRLVFIVSLDFANPTPEVLALRRFRRYQVARISWTVAKIGPLRECL